MRLFKWALCLFSMILILAGCGGASTNRQVSEGVLIEKGKPTLLFFYTDN